MTSGQGRGSGFTWGLLLLLGIVLSILGAWFAKSYFNGEESTSPIVSLDAPDYHSLLVDPREPDHILFGNHTGIQESRDGGLTWQVGSFIDADAMQLNASPNAPDTIYVTGHDVFKVSRDGGQTWQIQVHDLPGTDIHAFAQDPSDPNRLYAFVMGTGTLTSNDGGTIWELLPSQPPGGQGGVVLSASGGVLYAASSAGIAATNDAGGTWNLLPSKPNGQVISLATAASDPQLLYAGTVNGVVKSSDEGVTWIEIGPDAVPIMAIVVVPSDPNQVMALTSEGEIFRTDDGGATWN